jgi:two-component system, NarL family, nitrate/nitrite response regulator NarL
MDAVNHPLGPITILIAVAVRLYREGLAATLNAQAHLRVVRTVGTPLETQAAMRELQPDVVIVDVGLDDVRGLMRTLCVESPNSHILAFAVREDITAIIDYAAAGADGFVTASGSVAELVEAIERVAAGELLCSPRIAAQLLRRAAHQTTRAAEHEAGPVLTSREQQVFSLLKQGHANKEIAAALSIAEATVKNHVHHVLEKLQVGTRGQAAAAGAVPLKAALEPRTSPRRAS